MNFATSTRPRLIALSFFALSIAALWPANASAAPLSNVAAIAAGDFHTCALTIAGGVRCWGANYSGELGDGTTTSRSSPVDVAGLTSGVTAIAAGGSHTCALTVGGGVKCWGYNLRGALGEGTTTNRLMPVNVLGLASGVVAIAANIDDTCVVTTASGAKCWGFNASGEDGDGTTTTRLIPVDVSVLTGGVAAIATSGVHTCALTTAGGIKCWGSNASGSLGDGTTVFRLTAADVAGLTSSVAAIATSDHSCALMTGGGLKCWGFNLHGQIGDGTTTTRLTPVDVAGLTSGVAAVAVSFQHTCAITAVGGAKCWGYNGSGELGDGTTADRPAPVDVSGLTSGIAASATGYSHSCALTTGQEMKCWGSNSKGQLGIGAIGGLPQPLPGTVGYFAPQTVTFGALANHDVNDAPFPVAASATSGLTVTFSSLTSSICTVSGSTVSLVAIGICTIAAGQVGNIDYASAPQMLQSFLVSGSTPTSAPRLGNISTRMQVLTGNDVMIGGFAVAGPLPKTVVVRARGPSLISSGVTNALANPMLRLYSGPTVIASNDDWQSDASASMIQSIGFAPPDPREPAILVTLQPGLYTAIVSSAGNGTGVGIARIVPSPTSPRAGKCSPATT